MTMQRVQVISQGVLGPQGPPIALASDVEAVAGVITNKANSPASTKAQLEAHTVVATDTPTSRTLIGTPWVTYIDGPAPTGSVVFGGSQSNNQRIGNVQLCTILGGYDHEITQGIATTIVGGGHHLADAAGGHVFIGGGSTQKSHGSYAVNVGGLQNTTWEGSYNTCGGGRVNVVGVSGDATRSDATVSGGYQNTASGAKSTVGGGNLNVASGLESAVGGGRSNQATNTGTTISGGVLNQATGTNSTVIGGTVCLASGTASTAGGNGSTASNTYAFALGDACTASGIGSIALGRRAKATLDGQMTFSNSQIAAVGDAQTSVIVAKRQTTTAAAGALGLSGISGSGPIVIPDQTTWAFRILVVARRTDADNESAGYRFEGVIDRNTGVATTALVGAVTKTVLAEDTAAWDCNVTAGTTNGDLIITVTGEAAKTINWVARIELAEVTG